MSTENDHRCKDSSRDKRLRKKSKSPSSCRVSNERKVKVQQSDADKKSVFSRLGLKDRLIPYVNNTNQPGQSRSLLTSVKRTIRASNHVGNRPSNVDKETLKSVDVISHASNSERVVRVGSRSNEGLSYNVADKKRKRSDIVLPGTTNSTIAKAKDSHDPPKCLKSDKYSINGDKNHFRTFNKRPFIDVCAKKKSSVSSQVGESKNKSKVIAEENTLELCDEVTLERKRRKIEIELAKQLAETLSDSETDSSSSDSSSSSHESRKTRKSGTANQGLKKRGGKVNLKSSRKPNSDSESSSDGDRRGYSKVNNGSSTKRSRRKSSTSSIESITIDKTSTPKVTQRSQFRNEKSSNERSNVDRRNIVDRRKISKSVGKCSERRRSPLTSSEKRRSEDGKEKDHRSINRTTSNHRNMSVTISSKELSKDKTTKTSNRVVISAKNDKDTNSWKRDHNRKVETLSGSDCKHVNDMGNDVHKSDRKVKRRKVCESGTREAKLTKSQIQSSSMNLSDLQTSAIQAVDDSVFSEISDDENHIDGRQNSTSTHKHLRKQREMESERNKKSLNDSGKACLFGTKLIDHKSSSHIFNNDNSPHSKVVKRDEKLNDESSEEGLLDDQSDEEESGNVMDQVYIDCSSIFNVNNISSTNALKNNASNAKHPHTFTNHHIDIDALLYGNATLDMNETKSHTAELSSNKVSTDDTPSVLVDFDDISDEDDGAGGSGGGSHLQDEHVELLNSSWNPLMIDWKRLLGKKCTNEKTDIDFVKENEEKMRKSFWKTQFINSTPGSGFLTSFINVNSGNDGGDDLKLNPIQSFRNQQLMRLNSILSMSSESQSPYMLSSKRDSIFRSCLSQLVTSPMRVHTHEAKNSSSVDKYSSKSTDNKSDDKVKTKKEPSESVKEDSKEIKIKKNLNEWWEEAVRAILPQ